MAKLFNYSHPRYAARTLAKLRAKWPANKFQVELSPSMSYAFRYVIICILPSGQRATVAKTRF